MDTMITEAKRDLPSFLIGDAESSDWRDSDALVERWAQLNDVEFSEAVSNLTLAQIERMLPFIQGVAREHSKREMSARNLEDLVRQATGRVAESSRATESPVR